MVNELWIPMAKGFLFTIVVESIILWFALSKRHSQGTRLKSGIWLTACTYPIVWLTLPPMFEERWLYLLVAETFAPLAECAIFYVTFVQGLSPDRWATRRDIIAIVLANLASFGLGEIWRF